MKKLNVNLKIKSQLEEFDKKNLWYYLFVLDYLYKNNSQYAKVNLYEFISVDSAMLKGIFGPNYAKILRNLKTLNIIESNNSYLVGSYSTGYRLCIEFNKNDWEYLEIEDKHLIKRLNIYNTMKTKRKIDKTTPTEKSPGYKTVINTLLTRYSVQKKEALEYIKTLEVSDDIKLIYERKILAIANGDLFYTIDSYGHRLHTNETVLPRCLRQFILIDGKPCKEIDIANSQPLFFAKLLITKKADVDSEELDKYLKICEAGKFYEFFATIMGVTFRDENDRSEFKVNIFGKVLYCKYAKSLNKYQKAFKKEFPTIFRYLQNMKLNDYHETSKQLQRMESETIFRIIEKYADRYPDVSLVTIHDSLVVAFDEIKLLMKEVIEEMEKDGIHPKFNEK